MAQELLWPSLLMSPVSLERNYIPWITFLLPNSTTWSPTIILNSSSSTALSLVTSSQSLVFLVKIWKCEIIFGFKNRNLDATLARDIRFWSTRDQFDRASKELQLLLCDRVCCLITFPGHFDQILFCTFCISGFWRGNRGNRIHIKAQKL